MQENEDFNTDHKDFPSLSDLNDDDDVVIPEQFQRLRALLQDGKLITATALYGVFEDDHLPCFNVSVTVNGEEFKFGLWCIASARFVYELGRAPFVIDDHITLVDFIVKRTDPENPDL